MGLFNKNKQSRDSLQGSSALAANGATPVPSATDDPLGLATPPTAGEDRAFAAAAQNKAANAGSQAIDPNSGHFVALNAAVFLTEIAAETRGLFEEVRPVAEVKSVWEVLAQGPEVPKSAILSGAVNPHAAASLIVYHLRDSAEPLFTSALRPAILAASHTASDPERLSALRSVLPRLPDDTRALLSTICHLVAAVAAEHDACYKDGILTRQAALAQLFGPLMLRPSPASFDADMAAAIQLAKDLFSSPALLTPLAPVESPQLASPTPPPTRALPAAPAQALAAAVGAGAAGAAAAGAPAAPAAAMSPAVPKLGLKAVTGMGQGGLSSARPKGSVTFRAEVSGAPGRTGSNSSDDTNYINPALARPAHDPAHEAFIARVAGLSDGERKVYVQGALRGTPLLKYSSRGRAVALMFFRLAADTETLNWAHATSPEDLKYGLMLDTVTKVLPGEALAGAAGAFHGAPPDGHASCPARRMVVQMTGDQKLEVECLSDAHLEMWSVALQHVVSARAGPAAAYDSAPATHRNWGAQPTARAPPVAALGSQTARLLEGVAGGGTRVRSGGAPSGSLTARPGAQRERLPMGPLTARGPHGPGVEADVEMLNAHALFSKARHGRLRDCIALLDRGVPVDSVNDAGNSMLIIAAQNNHKKIAKEALRRNCDVNLQNAKGNTCLHYAFGYRYVELGHYLVSKGCDDTIRNIYNRTCYDGLAETNAVEPTEEARADAARSAVEAETEAQAPELDAADDGPVASRQAGDACGSTMDEQQAARPAARGPDRAERRPPAPPPPAVLDEADAQEAGAAVAAWGSGEDAAVAAAAQSQSEARIDESDSSKGNAKLPAREEASSTVQIGGRFERAAGYSASAAHSMLGQASRLRQACTPTAPPEAPRAAAEGDSSRAREEERGSVGRAGSEWDEAQVEDALDSVRLDIQAAEETMAQVTHQFVTNEDVTADNDLSDSSCGAFPLKEEAGPALPAAETHDPGSGDSPLPVPRGRLFSPQVDAAAATGSSPGSDGGTPRKASAGEGSDSEGSVEQDASSGSWDEEFGAKTHRGATPPAARTPAAVPASEEKYRAGGEVSAILASMAAKAAARKEAAERRATLRRDAAEKRASAAVESAPARAPAPTLAPTTGAGGDGLLDVTAGMGVAERAAGDAPATGADASAGRRKSTWELVSSDSGTASEDEGQHDSSSPVAGGRGHKGAGAGEGEDTGKSKSAVRVRSATAAKFNVRLTPLGSASPGASSVGKRVVSLGAFSDSDDDGASDEDAGGSLPRPPALAAARREVLAGTPKSKGKSAPATPAARTPAARPQSAAAARTPAVGTRAARPLSARQLSARKSIESLHTEAEDQAGTPARGVGTPSRGVRVATGTPTANKKTPVFTPRSARR